MSFHINTSPIYAGEPVKLALTTPMYRIAKSLANPSSGLEVKDRIWLKMTIPKSFIGRYLHMSEYETLLGYLCNGEEYLCNGEEYLCNGGDSNGGDTSVMAGIVMEGIPL